ncbi:MAG: cation:proton antiporter [Epsilonproteobacteria bacterium]|nr:cation:proton antiporter [Campylobacterota bacterium]MBD3839074.1 cation:proton antiporter [Campylobacterota bacterium]
MENLLGILIVTIAIATIMNVFLKKIDMPTVIGYIFTGLFISQIFDFGVHSKETLSHLAEFGIVFLMFTIGLEFSLGHMKAMKKEVFVYGGLQVITATLGFSFIAHYLFGLDVKSAIVVGSALSLSSTAIVLKLLNENNDIQTGYGRITLGVLLFQDLAVIPMLLMISIFTSATSSIGELLWHTFMSAIFVFLIIFLVGKYLIEKFYNWVIASNSEEIFLVSVFLTVISASVLANYFGFSYSLGAFLAGMTIAETKYRYRIEADLVPFRDILLGVFFITIGMQIDLNTVSHHGYIILALLVAIMGAKFLILFLTLKLFTQSRTALKSSLAVMQVGEFAMAIFALAQTNKLISNETNQILIITVVLSMILTPFILKKVKVIADLLFIEPEKLRDRAMVATKFKDHIIICGYGPLGKKMVKRFKKKGLLYVILEHDNNIVDSAIEKGEESIFLANAAQKSVLEHFNIKECLAIVIAISNDKQVRLIAENIDSFGGDINSIVKVRNDAQEEIIKDLNIRHIVNSRDTISNILVQKVIKCELE